MSNLAFVHIRKNVYLNDNGRFNLSINFRIDDKLYFVLLKFSNPVHLSKTIEYTKNVEVQPETNLNFYRNNLVSTFEEENPYLTKSGLIEYLIFILDKENLLRILNELINFTNYVISKIELDNQYVFLKENVRFKFTQEDNNSEILAVIEFDSRVEIEIDRGILLSYSGAYSVPNALQFYIDKIHDVITKKEEFKMIIRDDTIFESYFIILNEWSKYFGFIDNPQIEKPEYIDKVYTLNFIQFLLSFKKLLMPYIPPAVAARLLPSDTYD